MEKSCLEPCLEDRCKSWKYCRGKVSVDSYEEMIITETFWDRRRRELAERYLRDTRITLYCKTSGRAALAACALQSMGYLNVQSIAGGFDAWVAAGKSVAQPEQPSFE